METKQHFQTVIWARDAGMNIIRWYDNETHELLGVSNHANNAPE